MTTKTVSVLMKRLLEIDRVCVPDRAEYQREEENMNADTFTRTRRQLAKMIKDIRMEIEERNKLKGTITPHELALRSGIIRDNINKARVLGDELEKIHKKKKAKLAVTADAKDEKKQASAKREEIIAMMHRHFDELDKLSGAVGRDISTSDSGNDYEDGQPISLPMMPTQSKLKELDCHDFDQIMVNEEKIEEQLDELHIRVKRLKVLAIEAGEHIDKSTEQIERLQVLADTTTTELQAANRLLHKIVKEVKSPNAFCCDCILCLMVIGIAVGMYFALTN